jgi:hypothetical protein
MRSSRETKQVATNSNSSRRRREQRRASQGEGRQDKRKPLGGQMGGAIYFCTHLSPISSSTARGARRELYRIYNHGEREKAGHARNEQNRGEETLTGCSLAPTEFSSSPTFLPFRCGYKEGGQGRKKAAAGGGERKADDDKKGEGRGFVAVALVLTHLPAPGRTTACGF